MDYYLSQHNKKKCNYKDFQVSIGIGKNNQTNNYIIHAMQNYHRVPNPHYLYTQELKKQNPPCSNRSVHCSHIDPDMKAYRLNNLRGKDNMYIMI